MKTLLLMRHAKSSWKDPSIPDHERPLAKRGLRDSQIIGNLIGQRELVPQRIISSSAVRAAETARIINDICHCNDKIVLSDRLYLAEADAYIAELSALTDDLERVMLVGHNPGIESLLQVLSGEIESLPTAVLAYISLPIQRWSELTAATEGTLVELWRHKELAEDIKIEQKKEEKSAKKAEKHPKGKKESAAKVVKPKKKTKAEPAQEGSPQLAEAEKAKKADKKEKKKTGKK